MLRFIASLAFVCVCAPILPAAVITDSSQIPANQKTIDFSEFAGANGSYTSGPVEVGTGIGISVVFTSANPDGSYLGDIDYNLGVNGRWGSPVSYAGLDFDLLGGDLHSMTFTLQQGLTAVAALMNYRVPSQDEIDLGIIYGDVIIEALDEFGSVLESYNLTQDYPISTPGGINNGAIRGIARPAGDIFGFRVSNAGAILTDLTLTADDFPVTSQVPEPSTILLLPLGGALLVWMRRGR